MMLTKNDLPEELHEMPEKDEILHVLPQNLFVVRFRPTVSMTDDGNLVGFGGLRGPFATLEEANDEWKRMRWGDDLDAG